MTPSWLPLLMVVVLLALIGFLYWGMRRNLNRIDFEEKQTGTPAATTPDSPASPLE
jgi:protein-S-isoprenylcysteine O-methyltransferase Ste14